MSLKRKIAISTYPLRSGFVELIRLKFGFLNSQDRRYRAKILESNLFDPQHYRLQFPRNLVAGAMPLRHYILRGERIGLSPSEAFNPDLYLTANPDVRDITIYPLRHYLTFGIVENRPLSMPWIDPGDISLSKIPTLRKSDIVTRHRIAVVIHLFYHDLWEEISGQLRNLTLPYDLFVTVAMKDGYEDALEIVKRDFPEATAVAMPNHGRDIFPFLHLLNAGLFETHAAVLKLHTKKSPHREDGDKWRDHLIGSLLGKDGDADRLAERILSDPEIGFVVADGQVFTDEKWWGSNRSRTRELLLRCGIDLRTLPLRFPAGSIYWVTAPVLRTLRGLDLNAGHFEQEGGQLDATMAHVLERAMGYLAAAGKLRVDQVTQVLGSEWKQPSTRNSATKINAFYLPQFHPFPENDIWWGEGFTEWHGVTRAIQNFHEHKQPKLPTDLGFYDLRVAETLDKQGRLAASHGIDAFCVYYYWFDGKRLLEKPVDIVLSDPSIRFPFFFCWANEKWTRSWDGMTSDVLMDQTYEDGFEEGLADDLARYFADERYERHEGKPKFIIYRPNSIPDLPVRVKNLREALASRGYPEIYLGAALFHAAENSVEDFANDFDFFVEIPPHGLVKQPDFLYGGDPLEPIGNDPAPIRPAPGFRGLVYDYQAVIKNSLQEDLYPEVIRSKLRRGLMLGWDNTARRGREAHIAWGCNPASFHLWLRERLRVAEENGEPELYINAWNEWAEGTMLEPDEQFHDSFLRTVGDLTSSYE